VRLIDQARARAGTAAAAEAGATIDAVWKRIVPSKTAFFPLDEVPERPRLRFTIGREPPAEGRVRFEVLLEKADAAPALLYARDVATPGWIDEEIDLGPHDVRGAQLLFRKALLEGSGALVRRAHFAEPMLVSGAPREAPSVILISVDTLRADRVGAYGHAQARTPALNRLAAEGVWYANAYSASNWTYPSHAALLHGVYPASLPLLDQPARTTVRASPPSLGELFRKGGYLTAGFTGGGFVSATWGFHKGFDAYYAYARTGERRERCPPDRFDGPTVFAEATRWLQGNARHPFFLFIHTYDAHDRCEVVTVPVFTPWPDPGPDGRERFNRYYDDRIAAVDALIGRLLGELDALGLSDKVVVAVTSDHGEALWEHGFAGHGCPGPPFEELVRVPLIIRGPAHGAEGGRRTDQPVSAVDVAPTLLTLAGLTPPAGMDGYLLPGLGGESRPPSTPIFVHCDQNLAVRVGRYKLITSRKPGTSDAVYDLERDPGETNNVLANGDGISDLLRRQAAAYWTEGAAGVGGSEDKREDLDDSARDRLRALGYVR
jgi:arylsulfatase A-like enzyme